MLLELNIKDFAIIDNLHLRLHRLFNVFTGETGAGKSIIIDAMSALLGGKIGVEVVRTGADRATVEGVFSIEALPPISDEWQPFEAMLSADGNGTGTLLHGFTHVDTQQTVTNHADAESADARVALATLLHTYDITPDDGHLILSRDIFASGRTVGRINGRTVTQQVLQQVASWLVDIHGQSEHMSLLRPEQHVNFLDRYAELLPLREQLSIKVTEWRTAQKNLHSMQENERELARRADFQSALDLLRPALKALNELSRLDKNLEEHETNLSEALFRLEDVAASISSYESDIEDDPQRLAEVEERLDLIARLKRKYGLTTIEEILQRAADDQAELETIIHRDELIESLQRQDGLLRQEIGHIAQGISERRREAALALSKAMEEQLNDLNMQRARFIVEIEQIPDPNGVPASINGQPEQFYMCDVTGIDRVQFLIAPNPGEPFKPLTKIASGGETSRLMLALKTILAAADATPTLIFDEIDAGISGRSSQIVGEKLWQLTRNHQVICVTHLPQIAAFADTHYNVNKQVYNERTITIVNELRPEQRIREIAHIMGGNVTEFSMKSAEEMLARAYLWKENWRRSMQEKATVSGTSGEMHDGN